MNDYVESIADGINEAIEITNNNEDKNHRIWTVYGTDKGFEWDGDEDSLPDDADIVTNIDYNPFTKSFTIEMKAAGQKTVEKVAEMIEEMTQEWLENNENKKTAWVWLFGNGE